jgi:hypothetical protein
MYRRSIRFASTALAAVALSTIMVGGATAARSDLQIARAATSGFHSLAEAADAGFGQPPAPAPLHFCISSLDNTGAMGFHYINGINLDAVLDPSLPEVLVYAPDKHGRLKLAALEYVIFQADWFAHHAAGTMPTLFGQDFMPNDGTRFEIPPFFALHVWLFKDNPAGMFAPYNPNVSCDAASAAASQARTASTGSGVTLAAATVRDARWGCRVGATA